MKISDLTKFSISLLIVPLFPAWLIFKHCSHKIAIAFVIFFVILSLITFLNKTIANILKISLETVGHFLGKYISNIALFFIFVLTIIPTKILMVIVKRDRLKRRSFDEETYWINCDEQKHDYELEY